MCMEIGEKLREARVSAGQTQEKVAETIGVSRQTISNWENNRSYPDIISVLSLSDLYHVSLDTLLKEDQGMIAHLEESTNVVKSRRDMSRLILLATYLVIWAFSILSFWLGARQDAMGYSILVFYVILPMTTIILSICIGKDDVWASSKWILLLFFGFMYMLASYATFSLANMISLSFEQIRWPQLENMIGGILCSAFGMMVGSLVRRVCEWKKGRENLAEAQNPSGGA